MQQGAAGAIGWWCSGGTCSLAMPCIRRRLIPSLKISTCSEQHQAPSLSPSLVSPRVPSAPPQDIPVPMQLGTSTAHLACRVAFVGDPHHVLCRGKNPECPRHGETPGTGRDMGMDRALELDPCPKAAEGTPSTGCTEPQCRWPCLTFGFGIAVELAHGHRVPCGEMGTGDPTVSRMSRAGLSPPTAYPGTRPRSPQMSALPWGGWGPLSKPGTCHGSGQGWNPSCPNREALGTPVMGASLCSPAPKHSRWHL